MHAREELRQYVLAEPTPMQLLQRVRTALRATVALRPQVQQFAWRGMRRPLTPPHAHLAAPVHSPTAMVPMHVRCVLQVRTVWPSPSFQLHVAMERK